MPNELKETNRKVLRARELIYLASPYSHPDPEVRRQRYEAVKKLADLLISKGKYIFCPIIHSHEIQQIQKEEPLGWVEWMDQDLTILSRCTALYVMDLEGWLESKGVRAEREFAQKNNMRIEIVNSDGKLLLTHVALGTSL